MINNDKIFSSENYNFNNEQSQEGIIGESLNSIKTFIIGFLLLDAILIFVAFISNKIHKAKDKKLKERIKNNKSLMDKISNFFKMAYDDYCKYLETAKKTILEEINKSPKSIIDDVSFEDFNMVFKPISIKAYIQYCAKSFYKISKHPKDKSVIIELSNEGFFMAAKNQEVTDEHWKLVKSINSSIANIKFGENPLRIREIEEDDGGFGFAPIEQKITLSDEIVNDIKELMGK